MIKRYSATKIKNNFGVIVDEVYSKGNEVIVEKNNKPIMKISPLEDKKFTPLSEEEYDKVMDKSAEFRNSFKFNF